MPGGYKPNPSDRRVGVGEKQSQSMPGPNVAFNTDVLYNANREIETAL